MNPGPASGAGSDAAGRDQRHPAAEPGSRRRPGRRAACAEGPGFPIYARPQRPLGRCRRIREHRRQSRCRKWRTNHPNPRHRPRRARRPDLQHVVQSRRPAGSRDPHLAAAGRQRDCGRRRSPRQNGGARQELPGRPHLCDALRHHEIRQSRDQRGLPNADRGRRSGAHRHSGLPAGLAGDARPGDDRSGDDHRRLRRDGGAWVLRQSLDAVRHRARDRHRRRRRDRHRRGRLALCRAGRPRPRGGGQGDGRPDGSGHRHHAGVDVGIHSGRLPAGADRTDLPAVRARHCRHRLHQRDQRRDLEAYAKRAVAAAADPGCAAQLLLLAASTPSSAPPSGPMWGSSAR